jgi:gliding motility-associated-like protein
MMKKIFLLWFTLVTALSFSLAQPTFNISNTTGDPGGVVSVDFNVDDFTDILGMQFSINWDPGVLKYKSLVNVTNGIRDFGPDAFNTDPKFTDDGAIIVTWFDNSAEVNSVANGTTIFTIEFDIVGGSGSSTVITISDSPRQIEVIDENEANIGLNVNPGTFTASGGGGGGSLRLIGSDEDAKKGETVCIDVSVEGFMDIAGMQFSMNWDEAFLQFKGLGQFNLSGLNDGSFNLDNVTDGKLRLQWLDPASSGVTVANGTRIFQICFEVLGDAGSRNVSFSNDPLPIEIVDKDDVRVNFSKKDGSVTVSGTGGTDCEVDGFALVVSNENGDPNTEVCLDVSVKDFTNILTLSGSLEWDNTILSNPQATNFSLSGLTAASFNLDQGSTGVISFSWFDPATDGITLADQTIIFEVCFNVIGNLGQVANVVFSDQLTDREVSTTTGVITFNQCDGSVTVGGSAALRISKSSTNPSCPGDSDGSIDITVAGGTSPYNYAWSKDGSSFSNNEDLSNLSAGTYSVVVTDGAGAETSDEIVITNPSPIQISNSNIVEPNGANSDGAVDITVIGGTAPYTFSWDNGSASEDLQNVPAGNYVVTITDVNGCQLVSDPFQIGDDQPLNATVSLKEYNGVDVSCNGEKDGEATVNITGGKAPYTILWSNDETSTTISGLGAGSYSVTVTDDAGQEVTNTFNIDEPDPLSVSISTTASTRGDNGTAQAMVSGGTPSYSYRWNDGNPGSTTSFVTGLAPSTYTVLVTDANGCQINRSVPITPDEVECYTGRPVITPNNDGVNEELMIACVAGSENEFLIFNRQGEMVFEATNYDNSWDARDGSGNELPDGAYYWVLRVRNASGVVEQHRGHVSVLRKLN